MDRYRQMSAADSSAAPRTDSGGTDWLRMSERELLGRIAGPSGSPRAPIVADAGDDQEQPDVGKAREAMIDRMKNASKKTDKRRRDKQSASDPGAASPTPGEDMSARNRAASQRGALERPTDTPEEEPNVADARNRMIEKMKNASGKKRDRR